jgi:hypothetical protein
MAYNQRYTEPKNHEYGLYYTPMMMIDREQSVNGRDSASAQAAIRRALAKKPAVAIDVALALWSDGLSGTATIRVTSPSAGAEKTSLLICTVLREDGVVTHVPSGEKVGVSRVARFPARQARCEFIEIEGKSPATKPFPYTIEPTLDRGDLRLAAFVQDKRIEAVHQATDLLWRSNTTAATPATSPSQDGARGALICARRSDDTERTEGWRHLEGPQGLAAGCARNV